jgi:hypothetical protein
MIKTTFPLRTAALLCVALLVFASLAVAQDLLSGAACDNFGKTWSVINAPCNPAMPLTQCVSGARDTLNLLGCNPLPLAGTYVIFLNVFSVAAFNTNSACVTTYWAGKGNQSISGNVYNPGGLFGPFTLVAGACPAGAQARIDPARL